MELIDASRSAQQNELGNAELKAMTAAAFLMEGKDQFLGSQTKLSQRCCRFTLPQLVWAGSQL